MLLAYQRYFRDVFDLKRPENRAADSHAVAACKIAEEMGDCVNQPAAQIQARAMELFRRSTAQLNGQA